MRWPRRNGANGETIISNVKCRGLAMDDNRFLYVSHSAGFKDGVRRWLMGNTGVALVADGRGAGNLTDQLKYPTYVFVDRHHSVYVSDTLNHRVMKWQNRAREGINVAGYGFGDSLRNLDQPHGVVADHLGTVYVADCGNHRIMRWLEGAPQGNVIIGGNGNGAQPNQLSFPHGLSFDRYGNLYVVDRGNHRVQRFDIKRSS